MPPGSASCAAVAGPPSPEKPLVPLPAKLEIVAACSEAVTARTPRQGRGRRIIERGRVLGPPSIRVSNGRGRSKFAHHFFDPHPSLVVGFLVGGVGVDGLLLRAAFGRRGVAGA